MTIEQRQPTDSDLAKLDAYVDKRNVSFAEARAALDMPPADNSMFTADRIEARNRAHEVHVGLYHVPEDPTPIELTADQEASIDQSKREARQAVGSIALKG